MRSWLVSFTFGILLEILFTFGPFIALYLTFKFSFNAWQFATILAALYCLGISCGIIDLGYGLDRKYGWVSALRKLKLIKGRK